MYKWDGVRNGSGWVTKEWDCVVFVELNKYCGLFDGWWRTGRDGERKFVTE